MSQAANWTTAFDDLLTGRHRHCTQCGRQSGEAEYSIIEIAPLSVAVIICAHCRANDPRRAKLEALLRRRYGQERT